MPCQRPASNGDEPKAIESRLIDADIVVGGQARAKPRGFVSPKKCRARGRQGGQRARLLRTVPPTAGSKVDDTRLFAEADRRDCRLRRFDRPRKPECDRGGRWWTSGER